MSLPSRRVRGALALLLALTMTASGLVVGPAAAEPASGRPPRTAAAEPVVPPARSGAGSGRLDPVLATLADASAGGRSTRQLRLLGRQRDVAVTDGSASVLVQIVPGEEKAAAQSVAALGGHVTGNAGEVSRASVPASALRTLSRSAGVLRVTALSRPRKLAVTSEGVRMSNADRWQSQGTKGAGVKIGVIDIGYGGYADLMGRGLLPEASKVATAVFDSGKVIGTELAPFDPGYPNDPFQTDHHGAAVAEIVHDMAPDSQLYLAAIGDSVDVPQAVEWMNDNGVRVVNMSLGFISSPLDGGRTAGADNVANAAIDKAVKTYGMFWAGAAGNFRLNHWKGDFLDSDGDLALNWDAREANMNEFFYSSKDFGQGLPIEGILWWKDSWTAAVNDYDLVLFRWDESLKTYVSVNLGGQGETPQYARSGDKPLENVYANPSTRDGYGQPVVRPDTWYAWAIVDMRPWAVGANSEHGALNANAKNVDFDFFCPNQDLEIFRAARSIMTPADNESSGFMASAAIASHWDRDKGRPGFGVHESYSSEGPNQRGAVTPEISAADDVSNQIVMENYADTFAGTSASSPHVAGAAALVLSSNPSATAAQIEEYLKGNAIGLGKPGPDSQTGWGALTLPGPRPVDIGRLEGSTRYQTAIAISRTWADGSAPSVVLASGAEFPDALAGSSLAGGLRSPVLLTPPSGTFPELIAELKRLTAGAASPTVQILGSDRAVSRNVANQLTSNGFTVVRREGPTRYETAAAVANASLSIAATDTAFIVNGGAFPDALSAAPIAYKLGIPVLPVYATSIPAATVGVIQQRGIKKCIIVGSTSVVAQSVADRLGELTQRVPERWAGAGRYDTMKAVADGAAARGWVDFAHVGIASGANFPDALAGAAEAGRRGGPVLLSLPYVMPDQAADVIRAHASGVSEVRVYGSEAALEGAVVLGARWTSDH